MLLLPRPEGRLSPGPQGPKPTEDVPELPQGSPTPGAAADRRLPSGHLPCKAWWGACRDGARGSHGWPQPGKVWNEGFSGDSLELQDREAAGSGSARPSRRTLALPQPVRLRAPGTGVGAALLPPHPPALRTQPTPRPKLWSQRPLGGTAPFRQPRPSPRPRSARPSATPSTPPAECPPLSHAQHPAPRSARPSATPSTPPPGVPAPQPRPRPAPPAPPRPPECPPRQVAALPHLTARSPQISCSVHTPRPKAPGGRAGVAALWARRLQGRGAPPPGSDPGPRCGLPVFEEGLRTQPGRVRPAAGAPAEAAGSALLRSASSHGPGSCPSGGSHRRPEELPLQGAPQRGLRLGRSCRDRAAGQTQAQGTRDVEGQRGGVDPRTVVATLGAVGRGTDTWAPDSLPGVGAAPSPAGEPGAGSVPPCPRLVGANAPGEVQAWEVAALGAGRAEPAPGLAMRRDARLSPPRRRVPAEARFSGLPQRGKLATGRVRPHDQEGAAPPTPAGHPAAAPLSILRATLSLPARHRPQPGTPSLLQNSSLQGKEPHMLAGPPGVAVL
ncbi:basic proline-rich protein-like [Hippopotamus amphibius kiboko]|uniref:basic proline-rich protein-like n=1 Tax=Hippopotamus amphibius kiboko TaxID=575201 RepID=UPI0025989715|nr:basic proline-rich protein-like [Hippopotamus amphibius kiboko]